MSQRKFNKWQQYCPDPNIGNFFNAEKMGIKAARVGDVQTKHWIRYFKPVEAPISGRMGAKVKPSPSKEKTVESLCKSVHAHAVPKLSERLVGRRCTARVTINNVECNCLLDSQATTISKSFRQEHFPDLSIKPISNLLEVESANVQAVPYLGYIEISFTFPKELNHSGPELPTLALVVPDISSNSDTPLLIDTNTLDPLYEQLRAKTWPYPKTLPYGYQHVLRALVWGKKQSEDGWVGLVKLQGETQEVLPVNQKLLLEGLMHPNHAKHEQYAIDEQPTNGSLLGGVFVYFYLISLPLHGPFEVLVVLRNETNHDITLPTNCVIVEVVSTDCVIPYLSNLSKVIRKSLRHVVHSNRLHVRSLLVLTLVIPPCPKNERRGLPTNLILKTEISTDLSSWLWGSEKALSSPLKSRYNQRDGVSTYCGRKSIVRCVYV